MAQAYQISADRPDDALSRDREGQLAELRGRVAAVGSGEFSLYSFNDLKTHPQVSPKPCAPLSFGRECRLDRLLEDGLKPGTLTEILAASAQDAAAAAGFSLALASRFAALEKEAAIFWIYEDFSQIEQGALYAPGLALFGLDPARLVHVAGASAKDALWAMEEALKSSAPCVVVGELWSAKPYDLTASRRLLLAAQKQGTPALLFLAGWPQGADQLSSGADLRFEVRARRSRQLPSLGALPLPGASAWSVRIAKARVKARAGPGSFGIDREKFHDLFWDHEEALFRDALPFALAPQARDRSDCAALAQG